MTITMLFAGKLADVSLGKVKTPKLYEITLKVIGATEPTMTIEDPRAVMLELHSIETLNSNKLLTQLIDMYLTV